MKTLLNWVGATLLALVFLLVIIEAKAGDDYTYNILAVLIAAVMICLGLPQLVDDINKGSGD